MATQEAPEDRNGFSIAIVCALKLEAESVHSTFDKCWEDEGKRYGKARSDHNSYSTGLIGYHNVVLVHLPSMGSINAAASVGQISASFPHIELVLVVGICGAVPIHPRTKDEIILGDIIISTSITQYDFGRQYPQGFQTKRTMDDSLGKASPQIRSLINMLETRQNHARLERNLQRYLQSNEGLGNGKRASYPGTDRDWLFEADYVHQHHPSGRCHECIGDLGVCSLDCNALGCEKAKLVVRGRHCTSDRPVRVPAIHFGRYGSANTVMKSGLDRDALAKADDIVAFEMEGAGVWEQYPTFIIKSACDYADSHKNKDFQAYSADMAAAGLKLFLTEWRTGDQTTYDGKYLFIMAINKAYDAIAGPVWHVPFEKIARFVGRSGELKRLKDKIHSSDKHRVISVLGLGGTGKTRLALEMAHQIQSEDSSHSVFWLQAKDQLSFLKDLVEIGKKIGIEGIDEGSADVKALFKQRLSSSYRQAWVLILDNADDEKLWGPTTGQFGTSTLVDYLPPTTHGTIIVTTRSHKVAYSLAKNDVVDLQGLSPEQAVDMLFSGSEESECVGNQATAMTLVEKLAYHPLAITQACSFMNRTKEPASKYLNLLGQTDERALEIMSQDFEEAPGDQRPLSSVTSTWFVTFEHIREHHPLAAHFLFRMACLNEKGIPQSLLPVAEPNDVILAITVLVDYSFVRRQIEDRESFLESTYDMHRLVHLCVRNWLNRKGLFYKELIACIEHLKTFFTLRSSEIAERRLPPHFFHARRLCAAPQVKDSAERIDLLQAVAICLVDNENYADAAPEINEVIQWRERNLGKEHILTLDAYFLKGRFLGLTNRPQAATEYLQKAVDGRTASLGTENRGTLNAMLALGVARFHLSQYFNAQLLFQGVLKTSERLFGSKDEMTLLAMRHLGMCLHSDTFADQRAGKQLVKDVLEIQTRKFGLKHRETIRTMRMLKDIYQIEMKIVRAMELSIQLLDLYRDVYGKEHSETIECMLRQCAMHNIRAEYKEMINLAREASEIASRVFGPNHLKTFRCQRLMIEGVWRIGNHKEASKMIGSYAETVKRALGSSHKETERARELVKQYRPSWGKRVRSKLPEFYWDG